MNYNEFQQNFQQNECLSNPEKLEKKEIRNAVIGIALAVVGMYVLAIIIAFAIALFQISNEIVVDFSNIIIEQIFDIFFYVSGLFIPFLILVILYTDNIGHSIKNIIGTSIPRFHNFLLMIFIGLGVCMLGNVATNLFSQIMGSFGIHIGQPGISAPEGLVARIIFLFRITVLAAFFEEFAYRGVILSKLRRFGDGFAILISAIFFGVMHGNLVQAPFAFVLGLVLGYFYVLTGSIWVGVAIHFLNNLIPGLLMIFTTNLGDEQIALINSLIFSILLLLSLVSLFIFLKKYPLAFSLTDRGDTLTLKNRILAAMPGLIFCVVSIVVILRLM